VRIEVRDAGVGFTAEGAARAFEPFYTTKAGGLGLGLAICRSVAEAHGGRLWIASAAGPGATVALELPGREEAEP